jgi:hypothetical protein
MGFDWEEILGAEGEDIQDAYDDRVWRAYTTEKYDERIENKKINVKVKKVSND